ncbi:hypothetical protein CRG98_028691 [Punica granatum]|nr:hypothetical protein CRG98_028691 [Punica granatum]
MEMELDFGKTCTVGHSPKTVLLPSHRHHRSSIKKRNSNSSIKPVLRDDLLNLNEDFLEIDFSRFRSVSCKSVPSRPSGIEGKVELKRASVYRTSREIRRTKNMGTTERRKIEMRSSGMVEERKKIEISRGSDTTSCLSIVDSLCSSDEGSPRKRSSSVISLMSSEVSRNSPSVEVAESSQRDLKENVKFRCDEIVSRVNDGNGIREMEAVRPFPKSLTAKLQLPHSPSSLESGRASSKVRFSPIRKMFDPLVKSKSLRNPPVHAREYRELRTIEKVNKITDITSPPNDVSIAEKNCETETQAPKTNSANSAVTNSPIHLHGILKLGGKDNHEDPYFDFSVKGSEDVFLAKTWKGNDKSNSFNCVYTFHSLNSRKRSVGLGWESAEKYSTIVGQMQVSCYLHSELKNNGGFHNSLVMESVLHDIAQARRSTAQERSNSLPGIRSPQSSSSGSVGHGDFGSVDSIPLKSGDPHSDLEIAAVVIEVPCERRERFLYNGPDEKVTVVIQSGSHGRPESDSSGPGPGPGPSSLLERWRSGGGCDCGGWDMGCPLTVLGCLSGRPLEDQKIMERMNQRPLELYVQGSKDVTPALSITFMEEGHYSVDFHAQLSSLQAFSICVAMFHGAEVSASSGQNSRELSQCNSLKTLIEEEVKNLIEAVAEDKGILKKVQDVPTSYLLNPPFSPIARV